MFNCNCDNYLWLANLKNLQHIIFNDINIFSLPELPKKLRYIRLHECSNMTNILYLSMCSKLQYVTIVRCKSLTNVSDLVEIASGYINTLLLPISVIYLCLGICDAIKTDIISICSNLIFLELQMPDIIFLPHLTCCKLKYLDIINCEELENIDSLKCCRQLKNVNMNLKHIKMLTKICDNMPKLDLCNQDYFI